MRGKTIRSWSATASVVFSGTAPQTPLRPRWSRTTSPTLDECVCSRACRDLPPRRIRSPRRVSVSDGPTVGPPGRPQQPTVSVPGGHSRGPPVRLRPPAICPSRVDSLLDLLDLQVSRGLRRVSVSDGHTCGPMSVRSGHASRTAVAPGWKVRARTGTYGLVLRRRSRTSPPWSQGRLWRCPTGNDTRRRARAAYRFFLSMVLWEEPPTEAAAPRVVDPHKTWDEKSEPLPDHGGEQCCPVCADTDALVTSEVSSYFAGAERVRMFPCVQGLWTLHLPCRLRPHAYRAVHPDETNTTAKHDRREVTRRPAAVRPSPAATSGSPPRSASRS
jgi:hypothetical protein